MRASKWRWVWAPALLAFLAGCRLVTPIVETRRAPRKDPPPYLNPVELKALMDQSRVRYETEVLDDPARFEPERLLAEIYPPTEPAFELPAPRSYGGVPYLDEFAVDPRAAEPSPAAGPTSPPWRKGWSA